MRPLKKQGLAMGREGRRSFIIVVLEFPRQRSQHRKAHPAELGFKVVLWSVVVSVFSRRCENDGAPAPDPKYRLPNLMNVRRHFVPTDQNTRGLLVRRVATPVSLRRLAPALALGGSLKRGGGLCGIDGIDFFCTRDGRQAQLMTRAEIVAGWIKKATVLNTGFGYRDTCCVDAPFVDRIKWRSVLSRPFISR